MSYLTTSQQYEEQTEALVSAANLSITESLTRCRVHGERGQFGVWRWWWIRPVH